MAEYTVPEISMGATIYYGSDSYPYTIVEVSLNDKAFVMQSDFHTLKQVSKFPVVPNQPQIAVQISLVEPVFTPNPDGNLIQVRWSDKDVYWKVVKSQTWVTIGFRRFYQSLDF